MKYLKNIFPVVCMALIAACEDPVIVDTEDVEPSIVIDAWIDNRPATQTINITLSKGFYDESGYDRVSADAVFIEDMTDADEPSYVFSESEPGVFEWIPETVLDSFGIVGHEYRLNVEVGESIFQATSVLNPVPPIDSMKFNYIEESAFLDEGYEAEFFATDLEGLGNTYWIRGFKNGVFLDQPEYITTSFDGSFTEGNQDAIAFIPPLRTAINPFEENEDGSGLAPSYLVGDQVTVELMSINEEGFLYLNEIQTQTDRQGGISELFSVPITNLDGNIETIAGSEQALGFFSVGSVNTSSLLLTEELAAEARAAN